MRDESERGCTRFFIPSYDELSLFLMSVAFLILYVTDATLRAEAYDRLFAGVGLWIGVALVYFAAGMAFSIYHAFTSRPKSEPEKLAMFFFAVIASYASALASAIYIFKEAPWWFFVFPAWTLIAGAALVVMPVFNVYDESCIADDEVAAPELVAGLIFLVLILLACQYFFKLYWAITFSICVGYAMTLSRVVRGVSWFISWRRRDEEDAGEQDEAEPESDERNAEQPPERFGR